MALREREFERDMFYLKEVGPLLKIVYFPFVRNSGIEMPAAEKKNPDSETQRTKNERMRESKSRSKRNIYELALCNDWDLFFTGTIDSAKCNRYELQTYHKSVTQWMRNYNKRNDCKIKFLLVPELHKDGAVHLHGLLAGVPENKLHQFVIGDRMGKKIAEKVKKGETVYNWPDYAKKYGFCSLEPIRSKERVAKYIQKYITKELCLAVSEREQCYWSSRGLKKSYVICKGKISSGFPFQYDYIGDYASVAEFENTPEIRDSLLSLFDEEAIIAKNYIKDKNATV